MSIEPLAPSAVYSPSSLSSPMHGLSRNASMEEVATQFETVFMSILLQEMRDTLQDGLFQGEGSDTYGAMFDMFMGQELGRTGALGIRQLLLARYAENQSGGP